MFYLVFESHDGRALVPIPKRSTNQELMLAGRVDGVSANEQVARATLEAIRLLAKDRPTVYLPTHDPLSAVRLTSRSKVVALPQGEGQNVVPMSHSASMHKKWYGRAP